MKGRGVALLLAAFVAAPGFAAPAHEHGAATLDVVLDGDKLEITLDSPLDSLVGFEHAPRNDRQRAALADMESKLGAGERLFGLDAAARCVLGSVDVVHPYRARAVAPAKSGHGDADVTWSFVCAQPGALKGLEVRLFGTFPGLTKLRVQAATPRGQAAATLTPARRTLVF